MKKFNHSCPFCHKEIPKVYITRQVVKHKKRRHITRNIKEVIGENWDAHTAVCSRLKDFLNNTK